MYCCAKGLALQCLSLQSVHVLIGASLSKPHTSRTALQKCVNVRTCLLACLLACLRPYIVNFKCTFKYFTFKYFTKIECPRALSEGHSEGPCWATAYCQSAALATVAMTVKFNTHGTLLVCHSTYGPIINGRLHTDRTSYTCRVGDRFR